MTIAVLAEKPSVARDIARVLGANKRGNGFLHGNGYAITWAIGHLVTLAQPHEIHPEWRYWRRDRLPMLPQEWPLVIPDRTREQFDLVRRVMTSDKVEEIVCATDAGREGELIFRYIYEATECKKPVRRLWISSLTADAIRRGFERLRDGQDYDPLADAARGRSRADWLVGMNLSRACTLAYGRDETLSVGRVQTPTLAMVVERELEIQAFVPEKYREVVVTFAPDGADDDDRPTYEGTYFQGDKPTSDARRLPDDDEACAEIIERARSGDAAIESVRSEKRKMLPPQLYDLTELQRHANRLFGFSARKTLDIAQKLYEQRKLISYPRTDSRHLSKDVAATLPAVVEAIREPYEEHLAPTTGQPLKSRRWIDDSKVTDHHAIIPTTTSSQRLSADEGKIYDLICRRLLAAWHDAHVWSVTTLISRIETSHDGDDTTDEPIVDRYHSSGSMVLEDGWKVLDLGYDPTKEDASGAGRAKATKGKSKKKAQRLPPGLEEGQGLDVTDAKALDKVTRPPKRFTEATLLTAMETAGKTLDDKELSAAMRETGLGTPATRAETIETLLRRQYLERKGKALSATDRGIRLISVVHPQVKSPAMTGEWEAELKKIQRGDGELASFMTRIEDYVREVVGGVFSNPGDPATDPIVDSPSEPTELLDASPPPASASAQLSLDGPAAPPRPQREPTPPERLGDLLADVFGHDEFRPYQEATCRAVTEGKDALLVMPTGAGKSLCYQLPGLARAGTTLVVSPLIALMEDQVAKLKELGLAAERIHSGRARIESRRVCVDYLAGHLDFLFIAPERLSVPGFPEMLARRKPALIAVDEAHCISHWGHDFRPDYRMLGQRLPMLRPAPAIALTATATPLVQDDIAEQLGLAETQRFIHGFRRTNIAVEVAEMRPSLRREAVHRVLADATRRPAIVYAPSRKEAEALGEELAEGFPAAAYHAGMIAESRDRVQAAFLSGEIEVIVATIAFGMGIDKPDVRTVIHTGLPGSLEGYYQEIGRAGRDGMPSRAILLYSYADRRTHEFFHSRDYPEISQLEAIFNALTDTPVRADQLGRRLPLDEETFQKALEKLWIHHGALVDPEENVARGRDDWKGPYLAQRNHKLYQLEEITGFAQSRDCRMLHLVQHFGDQEDSGANCGLCDVCATGTCLVRRFKAPEPHEVEAMRRILESLEEWDNQGTGQLFKKACEGSVDRNGFERLLSGLTRAGLVETRDDTFDKNGRTIRFQRAALMPAAFRARLNDLENVQIAEEPAKPKRKRKRKAAAKSGSKRRRKSTTRKRKEPAVSGSAAGLYEALKAWRLAEAKRRRIPAFRVMSNRTLGEIAASRPVDEEELLAVHGIGPTLVKKYAGKLLDIVARAGS